MTPYYDEDGITIYHGDSREILPTLEFDVLITDPPYGVEFEGKSTKHTAASGGYLGDDDANVGPDVARLAMAVARRGAVFTGNRNLFRYDTPSDIGCVYCPSGAGVGPWGFTLFHPVLFYGKRPGHCAPTSMQSFATSDNVDHPCPKPLRWMTWIASLVSLPDEVILDPFMGSGTTLRAAKDLGRRAIGIEREERYCEVAASRLAQGVLDFSGAHTS